MTKKLILAVLSVVAVFAALGTTTFAWFSLTSEATITEIGASAEAGKGIEISVESATSGFKSNLSSTEVRDQIRTNLLTKATAMPEGVENGSEAEKAQYQARQDAIAAANAWEFTSVKYTAVTPVDDLNAPVSALDGSTIFKKIVPSNYVADPEDTSKMFQPANVNFNYIEFSLWIRALGDVDVYWVNPLDADGDEYDAITATGVKWVADYALGGTNTVVKNTEYTVSAANAARVSIQNIVHEKPAKDMAATIFGNTVTNTLADGLLAEGGLQFINVHKYAGSLNTLFAAAKTKLAPSVTDLTSATGTVNLSDDTNGLDTTWTENASTGWKTTGELKVRIWLEGWDPECFDSIYNDFLRVNFRFEAK